MNAKSIKIIDKPSIYIDTCIARDVTERRSHRESSIDLLTRIKREGWTCKMSVFGLAELVDIEQESLFVNKRYFLEKWTLDDIISSRRNRNLDKEDLGKSFKYISQFKDNYSFIELVGLSDDGWSLAVVVACQSNLHASDVIHLASAWQEDCDLLVTDDEFFISEAKRYIEREGIWSTFRICKPEDYYSSLKDMGFNNI